MRPICSFICLFNFLFVVISQCSKEQRNIEEFEEPISQHEKSKYYASENDDESSHDEKPVSQKFEKFLTAIEKAENQFVPCDENLKNKCECFVEQIKSDFKLFEKISEENIEASKARGVHYQIINHRLYRQHSCMFPLRCKGVEHFLLKIVPDLGDMEFVINVRDWPQVPKYRPPLPVLSFSKDINEYNDILYPAWSFWSGGPAIDGHPMGIGRWDLLRKSIVKSSPKWRKKKAIAFFRGSRTSEERDPLILLSRRKPYLIDAKYTKNQAWRSKADTLGEEPANIISFEEQCNYKYLFNLRGVAASFRHRHIFLCKSLALNVESPWIEFYYPKVKPWIHYIPIEPNFANVEETLEFLLSNDTLTEKIANTGYEFIWNHLTLDTVECYWRQLMKEYEKRLSYKPKHLPSLIEIH